MSRSDGKVVTKECLVTKPSRRKFSTWLLDNLVKVSVEAILMDDLYMAYQGVFW